MFFLRSRGAKRGSAVLQVGLDRSINHGCAGTDLVLHTPLFFSSIDLVQVLDAGILLGGGTGFDEVGDRDRGEQADDGDNDHDFNQRKAGRFVIGLDLHSTFSFFLVCSRECGERRFSISSTIYSQIANPPAARSHFSKSHAIFICEKRLFWRSHAMGCHTCDLFA